MDIRTRIIIEWNKGKLSMTQIGAPLGLSRAAVSGHLTRARAAGIFVLSVDRSTAARRQVRASIRKDPVKYTARLVQQAAIARAGKAAKSLSRAAE